MQIDPRDRDRWANQLLGLGDLPDDDTDLPRGSVPYLPSSVDVLLRTVDRARVTSRDVFVDVGSGLGRAMVLVHLMTGAAAVGLEIQAGLVGKAKRIAEQLQLAHVSTVHGNAVDLIRYMTLGSVFFFYCPFGKDDLGRAMTALEPLARVRPLRLCFVDMPAPELPWLSEEPAPPNDLRDITVWRTRIHTDWSRAATGHYLPGN